MKVFEQLHTASYEGFEFLISAETNNSGKKIVSHEYPNSDRRYSEELGKIPARFTLDVIVHGDINHRLRFETILQKPGLGTLSHPIYGNLTVMASTYSVSSDQTKIGEFRFAIIFEVSEANITPSVGAPSNSGVSSKTVTAQSYTMDALQNNYTPPTGIDGYNDVQETTENWLDELNDGIKTIVNPVQDNVNTLTRKISDARRNILTVAQNAETFRTTLEDLYSSISDCTETPADLKGYWDRLIGFNFISSTLSLYDNLSMDLDGSSVVPSSSNLKVDTVKRAALAKNRRVIEDSISYVTLINLAEALVYQDVETDRDIDNIRQRLNGLFDALMKDMPSLQASIDRESEISVDDNTRSSMYDLRESLNNLLDQREANVWKTVDINSKGHTSIVLETYKRLGNIDDLDLIKALNPGASGFGFGPTTIRSID